MYPYFLALGIKLDPSSPLIGRNIVNVENSNPYVPHKLVLLIREGESIIPIHFWYLSIFGGLGLLTYAIFRKDPVIITGQLFGIPVLQVQDVLSQQKVTHIPLAPKEIAGSLNLRGRIVTAIDVRVRLGATVDETKKSMSVVIEHGEELYSLVVDEVGDVLKLTQDCYEKSLATLDELWKEISGGIYRLDKELLVLLDIPRLLKSVYPKIDEINEVE